MCFSAEADLVGGIVLVAVGVDVARHLGHRRDHRMLAVLPLLLALHQFTEAFVWWGLQGHVGTGVERVAMWGYLLFAFVVLPVYVPLAVLALEPAGGHRRRIAPFIGLGTVVAVLLLAAMVRGPVTAELGDFHVAYGTGLGSGWVIVIPYVVATCGALLFSGYRDIAVFGTLNLLAVVVLARFALDGFASLWCAWAALVSGAIALHVRFGGASRSLARISAGTG